MRKRRAKDVARGDWAEFVRRIEQQTGLTSGPLGRMVGVTGETWWRWKVGRQRPVDVDRLVPFATAFEIPLEKVMFAAGMVPGDAPEPPPLSKIELRLRGLGLPSDDPVVAHILSLEDLNEQIKIYMFEAYREKLDNLRQAEIRWVDMVSGSYPVLTKGAVA